MKAVIVKAHADKGWEVGTRIDVTPEQFLLLQAEEYAVTESEWTARQNAVKAAEQLKQSAEVAVDNAIAAARERHALAPKEDAATIRATALDLELNKPGLGVAYVNNLPVKASKDDLQDRSIPSSPVDVDEDNNVKALVKGYLHASEPFTKELKNGGLIRACRENATEIANAVKASCERSVIIKKIADLIQAGANFTAADVIKAAGNDTTHADLQTADAAVGTLNTGLVLQWNLGFLKNQLALLSDITTDVSNQPVFFGQNVITRYINVPGVQLKNDRTAGIVGSGNYAWKGGSGSGTTDVNVYLDTHAGVPISFNQNMMGSTARQLFNEMKTPQMYALGEYIIYKLITTAFNGSKRISNDNATADTVVFAPAFTNAAGGHTFNVAGADLSTFVADLPQAMDESQFPGGDEEPGADNLQRFAWVHGRVAASVAADTNFLINQSIWGAVARSGENTVGTGRFSRLGNIKFRKSQLVTDQVSVTGTGVDGTTNAYKVVAGDFNKATKVGLAGTRSALLFVSRVPVDYTKALPEIPSTAAVELATEPETGITFMVVKYLDHAYETANMRAQLMFGTAIGHEKQGIILVRE